MGKCESSCCAPQATATEKAGEHCQSQNWESGERQSASTYSPRIAEPEAVSRERSRVESSAEVRSSMEQLVVLVLILVFRRVVLSLLSFDI